MTLPIDELLVFGPIAILTAIWAGRKAYLAYKYRHAP